MFFRGFIYFKVIVLCFFDKIILWMSKKTEKPIKPRKHKKKKLKKLNRKKNPIKPIKILKKPAGLVL